MGDLFLILDAAQAVAFRGPTSPGAALQPVALADGLRWVLPLSVLDDPAHAPRYGALAALPAHSVAEDEFPRASLTI